jgi:O-antigen ligase
VLGYSLIDAAHERAEMKYAPNTSVTQTLKSDPRPALWEVTVEKIKAQPWLGYGFGRGILRRVLPAELHDPLLTHPHNTIVSQWVQLGAVGLALFAGVGATLAWRYARFVRSRDDILALVGMIGLALLVGFMVKNLTDDFFYRSNAKLFWAMTAALLAYGTLREKQGLGARD